MWYGAPTSEGLQSVEITAFNVNFAITRGPMFLYYATQRRRIHAYFSDSAPAHRPVSCNSVEIHRSPYGFLFIYVEIDLVRIV